MTGKVTRILIANRGEIAARIAQGAQAAGVDTVGVYADSDFDSGFLSLVSESYALHGDRPSDTYLDQNKLIEIARRANCDAIHPGYGFLSENADFAKRVVDEGLIWIGPNAEVIDQLGDKVTARAVAASANAPLLPASEGLVNSPAEVIAFGDEHGYPVAVKAVYGGGGRGLRVVRSEAEAAVQFNSAREEARNAFGRDECFVEVFLDRPRHIETQVIADCQGNIVVVGTRDCSMQRRNQKVIEEAPAPFLDETVRAEVVAASKRIFREVGYIGVGTVEFLVDPRNTITFLEVNTRLQVEHPVTEEAYGIDLVGEQIRIANGESLSLLQDPEPIAHSLEFRINVEDASDGFLPSQGRVTRWDAPGGTGVRLDTDADVGTQVSGNFDSLLAKLVVTGSTRAEAMRRAKDALKDFHVGGVDTLIPFHRSAVENEAFAGDETAYGIHTKWIEEQWDPASLPDSSLTPAEAAPLNLITMPAEVDGRRVFLRFSAEGIARIGVAESSEPRAARARPKRRAGLAATRNSSAATAPMQGTIIQVLVKAGDHVRENDTLAVMEAMKMELPIRAHSDAIVDTVETSVGASVRKGESIVLLSPAQSADIS